MTDYNFTDETAPHVCESRLDNMKQNVGDYADTWFCVVCAPQYGDYFSARPRFGVHVIVEMLRERAAALDAATRLHGLRSTDPIEFREIGGI